MTKPTKWHAQADLSPRWAHSHFVGFLMSRLMLSLENTPGFFIVNCLDNGSALLRKPHDA